MNRFNSSNLDRIGVTQPTARFTVADVLKDCAALGLTDDLRAALDTDSPGDSRAALRAVRDLVYELASAPNKDLAVEALIYATGIAEFERTSLRSCAQKHGLTPEGFRRHVLAIQRRLHLPARPMQRRAA
jgi:hypothetical protein